MRMKGRRRRRGAKEDGAGRHEEEGEGEEPLKGPCQN